MHICVTADIERFSDGISKFGCFHKIDDTSCIRVLIDTFCEVDIPSTLFILGKFAQEEPAILDVIKENGHELASHGYSHIDLRTVPSSVLKDELSKSVPLGSVKGFRAPYYGLNKEMINQLELHFKYDSSQITVRTREFLSQHIRMLTELLMEIPISTVWGIPLTSTNMRFLPLRIVKRLSHFVLEQNGYLIINVHPWEFAEVPQKVAVPFYVKRNTGPCFLKKFSEFLKFLHRIDAEFVTMEQIYEYYRC